LIFSEGRHFGSQFRDVPAFHEKKNFKWNRWKIGQFLRFAAWNSTVTAPLRPRFSKNRWSMELQRTGRGVCTHAIRRAFSVGKFIAIERGELSRSG
jgi:hypothetical protein